MTCLRIGTPASSQKHPVRDSLVARITACRVVDRGSIPRLGDSFCFSCFQDCSLCSSHFFAFPFLIGYPQRSDA